MTCRINLLGTAAQQPLRAAQVAVDIGVEHVHQQAVQLGMDEARLRQQLLRCRLVVRLAYGREVCVVEDAPPITTTAARMDRQTLGFRKISMLFLVSLMRSFLVPVDVRCAVEDRLDQHIAIGMQRGVPPFAGIHVLQRQRFEHRALHRFESLAPRDAETGVAPCVDVLDALGNGLIDQLSRSN